ncbi:hypothetical protein COS54_01480 [Candidatus Shapirobacteria bacterium CG03_land_8_20_14_0_80_39_12]|uniref:LytR/CpsA/Psr regulator C-terminal domain-containing protein n=1 Tax=Candidatus Shapirobacteria bacterium CG03_land_8_20_14_0_80_39_12 TaxID=1974879 RepID=A0A2M7BDK3_9BACT|nr:MAG: hypothetical protein COS54_01480 [Candidatus Shapirobacteria bacterium CG03_land_8_20_14_0_80_39_12]
MKDKTSLVISITAGKLESGLVSLGEKPKVDKRKSFEWTEGTLPEVFKKIKSIYKAGTIGIVYDADVSETLEFSIPKDVTNERSFVGLKMAEKIPGILDREDWDFKVTGETKTQKQITVYAVRKDLLEKINLAAKEANLEIKTMEPMSLSEKRNSESMIGLVQKEEIPPVLEKVEEANPEIVKEVLPVILEEKKFSEKSPKKGKMFLLFSGIILLVGGLTVGGILFSQKALEGTNPPVPSETKPTSIPTIVNTAVTTPTPEITKKDLKVSVLNGSGIAGLASKAKAFLEGLGYQVVYTGNAEVFTYETTEVSIKEDKQMFLADIVKSLSEKYTLSSKNPTLDPKSEFDIVITLGKK